MSLKFCTTQAEAASRSLSHHWDLWRINLATYHHASNIVAYCVIWK